MRSEETKYEIFFLSLPTTKLNTSNITSTKTWLSSNTDISSLVTMESIHYTLADPQMIPVDMLDVILPEDMYRLNYSYPDHQDSEDEEEEEDREEAGVVSTVSRLLASPYKLFVYYLELWIDGLVRRTSYEKY